MINKYNSPEIDIIEINVSDVIMVSAKKQKNNRKNNYPRQQSCCLG